MDSAPRSASPVDPGVSEAHADGRLTALVAVRAVAVGAVCGLAVPRRRSLSAVRVAWGARTGLDPARHALRLPGGEELPRTGLVSDFLAPGAFCLVLTAEPLPGTDPGPDSRGVDGTVALTAAEVGVQTALPSTEAASAHARKSRAATQAPPALPPANFFIWCSSEVGHAHFSLVCLGTSVGYPVRCLRDAVEARVGSCVRMRQWVGNTPDGAEAVLLAQPRDRFADANGAIWLPGQLQQRRIVTVDDDSPPLIAPPGHSPKILVSLPLAIDNGHGIKGPRSKSWSSPID